MIERIRFQNYGPFREAELRLGAFTVIVGPNASGKTTALLALTSQPPLGGGVFQLHGPDFLSRMRRRGSESPTKFEFDTENFEARFQLPENDGEPNGFRSKDHLGTKRTNPSIDRRPIVALDLSIAQLRSPSFLDTPDPQLEADGYGLPTVLASLKLRDDVGFAEVVAQTRDVVPVFDSVSFRKTHIEKNGGRVLGEELLLNMRGAPELSADQVSDGTLFTLGLLTAIKMQTPESQDKPPLILIDELEHSLHPRALVELVGHLRRITEETGVQILATSHSPYLLDALHPEEVRLTGFLDDGTATIRELTDHPDFERWKDEMTPGEFWSLVGEDWIAKTEQPEPEEARAAEG